MWDCDQLDLALKIYHIYIKFIILSVNTERHEVGVIVSSRTHFDVADRAPV